jgi:tetratricopeptide (TPR) repeat protein
MDLNNLGLIARDLSDLAGAGDLLELALGLARSFDDVAAQATVLGNLGGVEALLGHLDEAERDYTEALEFARQAFDAEAQANNLACLGLVAWKRHDAATARACWIEARDLCRRNKLTSPLDQVEAFLAKTAR